MDCVALAWRLCIRKTSAEAWYHVKFVLGWRKKLLGNNDYAQGQ